MDLAPGTVVSDRYVIEEVIGEGGMAVVYRARHSTLGTMHAVKLLTMTGRAIRERMIQEGRLQARLRHPNIVAVTDVVEVLGAPALVMELVDGPSLDELVKAQRLTLDQADAIGRGVLAAVAHAHRHDLVHRDLKPANVMLEIANGVATPKVTDFGLAKILASDEPGRAATRTGATMGTPQYMSPEQIKDSKNVDARSDVFACGAILYELITGNRAFEGDNLLEIFARVAAAEYPDSRALRPDAPERMHAAIDGALKAEPAERTPTVAALYEAWSGEPLPAGSIAPASMVGTLTETQLAGLAGARAAARPSGGTLVSGPPPTAPSAPPRSVAPTLFVGGGLMAVAVAIGVVGLLGIGGLIVWSMPSGGPVVVERTVFVHDGHQVVVAAPDPVVQPGDPEPAVGDPAEDPVPPTPVPVGIPWSELPEDVRNADVVVVDPEPVVADPDVPDPDVPPPAEPEPVQPVAPAPASVEWNAMPASLRHSDPNIRRGAVFDTYRKDQSDQGARYLAVLMDQDQSADVRRAATEVLMERWAKGTAPAALGEQYARRALAGSDGTQRNAALRAYATVGSSLGPPSALLAHRESSVRRLAIDAVEGVGLRNGGLKDEARRLLTERLPVEENRGTVTQLEKAIARLI